MAAMDLVLDLIGLDARRTVALGLLRNPFFRFPGVEPGVVAGLDRELAKRREPGGTRIWKRMLARWRRRPVQKALPGMEDREQATPGIPALEALVRCTAKLSPLAPSTSSLTEKVEALKDFLSTFGRPLPAVEGSARHERARGAFMSILERLAEAARHVGDPPITFREFREKHHRAIESHTFSIRTGGGGIQIVDSRSAGFGSFDLVLAVGLNEGEWPSRAERNIFYPQWILKDFGWPTDAQTLALERAYFVDLLRLPTDSVGVFRHLLEDEIPTVPSPFLEEVEGFTEAGRKEAPDKMKTLLISRAEALRNGAIPMEERFQEKWSPGRLTQSIFEPQPISATAFELYLRCPFKHFARYVLGIVEEEDIEESFTPLERGRVLHDILQTGFDRWDAHETGPRPITAESYDEALNLFKKVALEKLPAEKRLIEMARLFGGPGEPGAIEWLLRLEMKRGPLRRRLLEYAFGSTYRLDMGPDGESPWHFHIKGRADRVDIDLRGHLHLFDYKSGRAPESKLTIQVPLYALCLSQEMSTVTAEAAYVSLRDKKIVPRQDYARALDRLRDTFERISEGHFAPRPYQDHLCHTCGYVSVCRKEIVETKATEETEAT
jgi:RecB family exonuclease